MNILTDILSLFKRRQFEDDPRPDDVLVLGIHEPPEMTGVASPIPYKSVKLIKLRDLVVDQDICPHVNVINEGTLTAAGVFKEVSDDPCEVRFRSLVASGNNLTIVENNNEITFTTEGEPNTAANVGSGEGVWKNKVGETLNFKSLVGGTGISVVGSADEITISASEGVPNSNLLAQNQWIHPETTGATFPTTSGSTYRMAGYPLQYDPLTPPVGSFSLGTWDATYYSAGIDADPATGFNSDLKQVGCGIPVPKTIPEGTTLILTGIYGYSADFQTNLTVFLGLTPCSDETSITQIGTDFEVAPAEGSGKLCFRQEYTVPAGGITQGTDLLLVGFQLNRTPAPDDIIQVTWSLSY